MLDKFNVSILKQCGFFQMSVLLNKMSNVINLAFPYLVFMPKVDTLITDKTNFKSKGQGGILIEIRYNSLCFIISVHH
jgi:hypothetical protein